jgi:hypothetical protein
MNMDGMNDNKLKFIYEIDSITFKTMNLHCNKKNKPIKVNMSQN